MAQEPPEPLLAEGIELFNQGFFFEAHELLEGGWLTDRSPSRAFFQGLIQVASAYHHAARGNWRGAADLLARGGNRLRAYGKAHLGVDLEDLLAHVDRDAKVAADLRDGRTAGGIVPPKIRTLGLD